MKRWGDGSPVRLTRRGRAVRDLTLTAAALLAALVAGLTAQAWNPCTDPATVCALEVDR